MQSTINIFAYTAWLLLQLLQGNLLEIYQAADLLHQIGYTTDKIVLRKCVIDWF